MKTVLKKLIPSSLQPALLQLRNYPLRRSFLQQTYPALTALKCQIAYNKYGAYCVPNTAVHRPAARKVLSHDVYEPETISFIRENCGTGDIVHAGTFFGDFLPGISSTCSGLVWAFEPNPQSHRCAQITVLLNDLNNVRLHHCGLGETSKRSFVQTTDQKGSELGGASHVIDMAEGGATEIEVVSIDSCVPEERHISIIQLDVEGYEEQALRGALKSIQRCLPIIILEIIPDSNLLESPWIAQHILPLGYRLTQTLHGNAVLSVSDQR